MAMSLGAVYRSEELEGVSGNEESLSVISLLMIYADTMFLSEILLGVRDDSRCLLRCR